MDPENREVVCRVWGKVPTAEMGVVSSIRVHYYGAFAKMNASFFSFLPAQREKSCVTRLYFLPQNK